MAFKEKTDDHAPCWYNAQEASAWASGYNKAGERIARLETALERLKFWNEGIQANRGNHHPHDHLKVINDALAAETNS